MEKEPGSEDPDEPRVKSPDGKDAQGAFLLRLYVHPAPGKILPRARVAFPAGLHEVGRMYGRTGVGARKDVMDPVTGGAVGHGDLSVRGGDAVVAVIERAEPFRWEAVLGLEGRAFMA